MRIDEAWQAVDLDTSLLVIFAKHEGGTARYDAGWYLFTSSSEIEWNMINIYDQ
jgi:hypothetical protein